MLSPEFIKHNGQTLKVCPLTLLKQEELASYLKFRYMDEVKAMAEGLPEPLWRYAWDKAKEKSDKFFPGTIEHSHALYTPHGIIYALRLASATPLTDEEASDILFANPDAFETVGRMCGYTGNERVTGKAKPLPVDLIIHRLCNAPWNFPPDRVRQLTLDEIAIIWCEPQEEGKQQNFSQADQTRLLQRAAEARKKNQAGIWAKDTIWK